MQYRIGDHTLVKKITPNYYQSISEAHFMVSALRSHVHRFLIDCLELLPIHFGGPAPAYTG